jgi:hypothetical protein
MGLILKSLGVLFLFLIFLVIALILFIRFKVRQFAKSLSDMVEGAAGAGAMPNEIELERVLGEADWNNEDGYRALSSPLPDLGFEDAGLWRIDMMGGILVHAWVKPEESVYSIVYEHPQAGVWMDFVTYYENGESLTYSNTPMGGKLEKPPGKVSRYFPELGAVALFEKMMAERPDRPLKPISADTFQGDFERAYAEEMEWRNSRGGPSLDEVRATLGETSDGEEIDEDMVRATHQIQQSQALQGLQENLRKRFLQTANMPPAEWEEVRERLVFVHDRLSPDLVREIFTDYTELEDDEVHILDSEHFSARRAFSSANAQLRSDLRFRKLGELTEPVAADVYCAPE